MPKLRRDGLGTRSAAANGSSIIAKQRIISGCASAPATSSHSKLGDPFQQLRIFASLALFVRARATSLIIHIASMLIMIATVSHALVSPRILGGVRYGRKISRCGTMWMSGEEGTLVRLDKLLADRGAGSRKDVDRLIRKGLVEIEDPETGEYEIVGKSGGKLKVPWDSAPIVDGFDYPPPPLLAAYHKPLGVVSTMKDDKGRPDLASVLPQPWQKALHPVGRLDADTTGLLLFCRDGELTHRLLHPKYIVEREYLATVENSIDEASLRAKLAEGVVTIEDGEELVVQGDLLSVDGQVVRAIFREGKYRMVRRILANCGHPVSALHRVRYGEVHLGDLYEGDAEPVEPDALEWARELATRKAPPRPGRRA